MEKMIHTVFILIYYLMTGYFYVTGDHGLPVGAPCITAGGINGTCLNIYECPVDAAAYIYNQSGFLRESEEIIIDICSYDKKEPIVCCTDCRAPSNEFGRNDVAMTNGNIRSKDGPVAWNRCLDYFQRLPYGSRGNFKLNKVFLETRQCHILLPSVWLAVGGREAERWEFPHVALLGFGESRDAAQWMCGGSIISERYILTAAHCSATPELGSLKYAALGILKRSDPKELWNIYDIKRIIMHPDYKSPSKYNDIALLETQNEITFSRSVLPACLDVGKMCTHGANIFEAAGWGTLGHGASLADHLQVIHLDEYTEDECAELYGPHRHLKAGYNHTTQMCYGRRKRVVNTCQGDSGGPLQVSDDKYQYSVIGVTSYGHNCGELGSAGIYTRVRHYVPWIESVVWPNDTWTGPIGTFEESLVLNIRC